jgi:hypothetical protein
LVSTRTIILIGAGLAIAAGLVYIQYQFQTGDSPLSQQARARLGLDKPPQSGRDQLLDIIEDTWNKSGSPLNIPRSANYAAFYSHDLSREEEKYEQNLLSNLSHH